MRKSAEGQLAKEIVDFADRPIFPKVKSMSQGYAALKYFKRVETIQFAFGIMLVLELLLLHIYFELDVNGSAYAGLFNNMSLVVGMILIVQLAFGALCSVQYEKVVNRSNDFISSTLLKIMLILIIPYPFIDHIFIDLQYPTSTSPIAFVENEYTFKLNYLMIIFTIFRSCFFVASYCIKSRYMSPRAERICKMYGAKSGAIFCLRSIFKDSPFTFMTATFLTSVIIFSFLFRIAEYQIYSVSCLTMYSDMAWMTVITMTSVGYGDYTPKTPVGRLIGALCVSWGVLIVSVMVVVLTNTFSMNRNESQSLHIITKLEKDKEFREVAGKYIRQSLWRVWRNYKYNLDRRTNMRERKIMLAFRHFRRLRDMALISESDIDFFNEMVRQFSRAFINLDNLTTNNMKIINYINQEYIFKEGLASEVGLILPNK